MREVAKRVGFIGSEADFLDHHVLTAHYVPFRSPRFEDLENPGESLAFANTLWKQILGRWVPRTIITIDRKAFEGLSTVLAEKAGEETVARKTFPTGWGTFNGDVIQISGVRANGLVTLMRLPHLSTFKLFSRPECAPHLAALLDYALSDTSAN
jgi:hypothetical protein